MVLDGKNFVLLQKKRFFFFYFQSNFFSPGVVQVLHSKHAVKMSRNWTHICAAVFLLHKKPGSANQGLIKKTPPEN